MGNFSEVLRDEDWSQVGQVVWKGPSMPRDKIQKNKEDLLMLSLTF